MRPDLFVTVSCETSPKLSELIFPKGCRKGNRDCEFPPITSSAKRTKTSEPKSATSETRPDDADLRLDTIKDESGEDEEDYEEEEDEPTSAVSKGHTRKSGLTRVRTQSITGSSRPQRSRQQSNTSIRREDHPTTPSTENSGLETPVSPTARRPSLSPSRKWKQLKPDLKPEMEMYLQYQREHMTNCHYMFKVDPEDFVHNELIDLALRFEPLLYAVVAFAAYHYTVRLPESQADFNSFWKYYCKSIVKLRRFLESTDERNDLVLLTVLQLATFEEYLGDWTNLASHHRAAYGILISKYTPETIMKTDRGRKMFDWYVRLDVISGLMAIRDVALDRSWLDYALKWHEERSNSDEGDKLNNKLEFFSKCIEVIGHNVAHTFASANELVEQGQFPIQAVLSEASRLTNQLDELRRLIQQLNDPALSGVDAETPHNQDDAFDPNIPLFRGALWPLNIIWLDWYGMLILLKNQILLAMQKAQQIQTPAQPESGGNEDPEVQGPIIPPELMQHATVQCQIYNAIDSSPSAPAGTTLLCYAALGLSSVFLPRAPPASNSKYTMWARRKLANIENQGYIWPPHFRKQMAQLWQDPEIEDWWLPNGEGKSRILGEVRMVVEDRINATVRSGKDDGRGDLREIKGLFEKMDIGLQRRTSNLTLDPTYVNSSIGMAHAASMVSSPEDGSSTGSIAEFSPRGSLSEIDQMKQRARNRNKSLTDANAPTTLKPTLFNEMNMNETLEQHR